MYSIQGRVRYSETNERGKLTISALINYFQDCCSFQSEDLGAGVELLEAHQCAWVLGGWEIAIHRMPDYAEKVIVSTWPYFFRAFQGKRNFELRSESGELLACANTAWIFINTKTGRPQKVDALFSDMYELEPPLDMKEPPRKASFAEGAVVTVMDPVVVARCHLDSNHHVNNGQYVQIAKEYLDVNKELKNVRVEYKKAAVLGDVFVPKVAANQNVTQVELCNTENEVFAYIEFDYI